MNSVKNVNNSNDCYKGTRSFESLSNGLIMPIQDYCRILDMMLELYNSDKSEEENLVSLESVHEICNTSPMCQWIGEAQTKVFFYPTHKSYVVVWPQFLYYGASWNPVPKGLWYPVENYFPKKFLQLHQDLKKRNMRNLFWADSWDWNWNWDKKDGNLLDCHLLIRMNSIV